MLPISVRASTPSGPLIDGLAELLLDSVAEGNSIGFLHDLSRQQACAWWLSALQEPGTATWVAIDPSAAAADGGLHSGDDVLGCVRLTPAGKDNARHRAEVGKLLVHRRARRQGIAAALMGELEREAASSGQVLLLLDTCTGSPAEQAYRGWGWTAYGIVEDHAALPDGRLAPTTFFTKRLDQMGS